jgi:hypothetical protein
LDELCLDEIRVDELWLGERGSLQLDEMKSIFIWAELFGLIYLG